MTEPFTSSADRTLQAKLNECKERWKRLREITDAQSKDEGLWFKAENICEDYLQKKLRYLHDAIEALSLPTL